MLLAIVISILAYAFVAWHGRRHGSIWTNPFLFVVTYYFFNYPVRAFLLVFYPEEFNAFYLLDFDIVLSLLYSSLYLLIFSFTYLYVVGTKGRWLSEVKYIIPSKEDFSYFYLSASVVIVSTSIVLLYEVASGGKFSLGENITELQRPFWVNVFGSFRTLNILVLALGTLLYVKTKNKLVLQITLILASLNILLAILSTGKGIFVALGFVLLFVDSALNNRTIRWGYFSMFVFLVLMFSGYSYYQRLEVGLNGETGNLDVLFDFINGAPFTYILESTGRIIDRGTYYLDGLTLSMISLKSSGGDYYFGSAIEILNLIPRFLHLTEGGYSFDRYITSAVWGLNGFSETFIGRIGESYFVLGWFGLFYAIANGFIFGTFFCYFFRSKKNLINLSLYCCLMISWLNTDVSLFYNFKVLVSILVAHWFILIALNRGSMTRKAHFFSFSR